MFEAARPFLLALAIGLLIGLERERAQSDHNVRDPLGSRSFTLLALLGAVAAHARDGYISLALALFAAAIIVAGYFRTRLGPEAEGVGITTEVAAMATFALGYLAYSDMTLAVMLAVITLVLLALKPRIHAFARAGLTDAEVRASLGILVIAFVVLPLLPDRFVDPWKLFNPFRLWLLLVAISGIGFAGYIAVRVLGPERGLAAAGFSAGLVSSTAAAATLADKSREGKGLIVPAAIGIVLANVASAGAQIVVVALVYEDMVPAVIPVLGGVIVVGLVSAAVASRVAGHHEESATFPLDNPLSFRSSVLLASILAAVLLATSLASRFFGSAGVFATAVLGGAANSHAVTLAMSTLAAGGSLTVREAVLAIFVGFGANLFVKTGVAGWVGGRRLLLAIAPPVLAMVVAGALAYWLVPIT